MFFLNDEFVNSRQFTFWTKKHDNKKKYFQYFTFIRIEWEWLFIIYYEALIYANMGLQQAENMLL